MPTVVLAVGDNVSTDTIYPGRFMATVLPSETPRHAFADHEAFNTSLRSGAIPAGQVDRLNRELVKGPAVKQIVLLQVIFQTHRRVGVQGAERAGAFEVGRREL